MKNNLLAFCLVFASFSCFGQATTFDCSSSFWTVNVDGVIQQWKLANEAITGGETILTGAQVAGIALCNDSITSFYSPASVNNGLFNYNGSVWEEIPVSKKLQNNGCHLSDQYFLSSTNGPNSTLYHFDGVILTLLESLVSENFTIADVAVDSLGRAWVFKGNDLGKTKSINVYDRDGLVMTFDFILNSFGHYGSFFLNNTLYIGSSSSSDVFPNSITPIIINTADKTAELGSPIPFVSQEYVDFASCQIKGIQVGTHQEFLEEELGVFPNPSFGEMHIKTDLRILKVEVYNLSGQLLIRSNQKNNIDLNHLSNGMYWLRIKTLDGTVFRKIVKQ